MPLRKEPFESAVELSWGISGFLSSIRYRIPRSQASPAKPGQSSLPFWWFSGWRKPTEKDETKDIGDVMTGTVVVYLNQVDKTCGVPQWRKTLCNNPPWLSSTSAFFQPQLMMRTKPFAKYFRKKKKKAAPDFCRHFLCRGRGEIPEKSCTWPERGLTS